MQLIFIAACLAVAFGPHYVVIAGSVVMAVSLLACLLRVIPDYPDQPGDF